MFDFFGIKKRKLANDRETIKQQRWLKYSEFWNRDLFLIREYVLVTGRSFYWYQLIPQTIHFWMDNNDEVTRKEFDTLVETRGFSSTEAIYLWRLLKVVGLVKET